MERTKRVAVRQAKREREVKQEKAILVIAAAFLVVMVVLKICSISVKTAEEMPLDITQSVLAMAEETAEEPEADNKTYMLDEDPYRTVPPFNTMSADWSGEDVKGFVYYEIPAEYAYYGGLLPQIVQVYTYILCNDLEVDYTTILAMIETESAYKWDAESSSGAVGYMQIMPQYHTERVAGSDGLKYPYQNIRAGIEYMHELLEKYGGNYEKALTAYRYGQTGAQNKYFSSGQTGCEYSDKVLETADRIRQQLESVTA